MPLVALGDAGAVPAGIIYAYMYTYSHLYTCTIVGADLAVRPSGGRHWNRTELKCEVGAMHNRWLHWSLLMPAPNLQRSGEGYNICFWRNYYIQELLRKE
jgi:hypothetical protein